MAQLQADIRTIIKKQIPDQQTRKRLLWEILNNEQIWHALTDSYTKAYKLAIDITNLESRGQSR